MVSSNQVVVQTVLVIEDDETFRDAVSWCLLARGYRVITAADTYRAMEAMLSARVSLLLLDMSTSRIDGKRLLRTMGNDPSLARLPVLTIAGAPDQVPPDVFVIPKPFDEARLIEAVEGTIGPALRPLFHRQSLRSAG